MDRRKKEVAKLIAGTLANISVIGFGLAIYENRLLALIAGILAISRCTNLEGRTMNTGIAVIVVILILGGIGLYLTRKSKQN